MTPRRPHAARTDRPSAHARTCPDPVHDRDHDYDHDRRSSDHGSSNRDSSDSDHTRGPPNRGRRRRQPSRRRVLHGVAVVGVAALAGCLSSDEGPAAAPAEPVALTDGQVCAACGMLIDEHVGPAGQIFYADGDPDADGPATFDSVSELAVFHAERLAGGATTDAVFVTDYSNVDYVLEDRADALYISRHVEDEAFADATTLSFVAESAVDGSMGPDYIAFSDPSDAAAFADDHGGRVLDWEALVGEA